MAAYARRHWWHGTQFLIRSLVCVFGRAGSQNCSRCPRRSHLKYPLSSPDEPHRRQLVAPLAGWYVCIGHCTLFPSGHMWPGSHGTQFPPDGYMPALHAHSDPSGLALNSSDRQLTGGASLPARPMLSQVRQGKQGASHTWAFPGQGRLNEGFSICPDVMNPARLARANGRTRIARPHCARRVRHPAACTEKEPQLPGPPRRTWMSWPSTMSVLLCGILHWQLASVLHVFQVPGGQGLHSTRFTCRPFCRRESSGRPQCRKARKNAPQCRRTRWSTARWSSW